MGVFCLCSICVPLHDDNWCSTCSTHLVRHFSYTGVCFVCVPSMFHCMMFHQQYPPTKTTLGCGFFCASLCDVPLGVPTISIPLCNIPPGITQVCLSVFHCLMPPLEHPPSKAWSLHRCLFLICHYMTSFLKWVSSWILTSGQPPLPGVPTN